MSFLEKYSYTVQRNDSFVCVGLDPDLAKLPEHLKGKSNPTLAFLREIIDATRDIACAYKPNFAFFGALGIAGWEALPRRDPIYSQRHANCTRFQSWRH